MALDTGVVATNWHYCIYISANMNFLYYIVICIYDLMFLYKLLNKMPLNHLQHGPKPILYVSYKKYLYEKNVK